MLLAAFWRIPFEGHFFHGLEYEDAYVYAVAGRYLSEGEVTSNTASSPYLITVCAVGNWNNCRLSDTFSGHFVGYPFIIATVSSFVGFDPSIGSYISLSASFISVVCIFLAGTLMDTRGFVGTAGSLVYCLTPVFAVHGVGTYAEPVSGALVVICLLLFMRLMIPDGRINALGFAINWLALTLVALFSIVVKRENLLLLPALFLVGLAFSMGNHCGLLRTRRLQILMTVISISMCVVFAFGHLQLHTTIQSETEEFSIFPFGTSVLTVMLPLFVRAFSSTEFYLFGGVFFLIGVVASLRSRRLCLYAASLFIAYLLLYASHVRSFYQLESGDVAPLDTLRYSMNLAGLWSLIAGVGIAHILDVFAGRRLRGRGKRVAVISLWVFIALYTLGSWIHTSRLREDMVANERAVRIQPAQSALQFVRSFGVSSTFVVTAEPLLIHMLADEPVSVIDFRYMSTEVVNGLLKENPDLVLLYLEQMIYTGAADKKRYVSSFASLGQMQKTRLHQGDNYSVYRLELPP